MRPLSLPERGVCSPTVSLQGLLSGDRAGLSGECALTLEAYTDLIVASGFPGLQHLDGANLRIQLDSYIARIVDADMESESGRAIRMPSTVMAWLRSYAAATATTMSWEKIRDTAHPGKPPARSTAIPYRDILTRLRILDAVEPWTPGNNHMKTMSQVPKHHLADPALAARLVGLEKGALLDGAGPSSTPSADPFLGQLFESLVALSLRVFVGTSGATVQHLRTHRGTHEIDYIVKRGDGKVVAIEVKLSPNVDDKSVRHLTWLRDEIGASLLDAAVITTGAHAYRRTDGIAVIPLGLLGP